MLNPTLDPASHFDPGQAAASLECPQCRVYAHMSPSATPDFQTIRTMQPEYAGVVFQCDACHAPVFMKYRVKRVLPHRVDFFPVPLEVERPREKFSFNYLPEPVAEFFRDALGCYRHGLLHGFTSMCRQTAIAMQETLDKDERLRLLDQMDDIRRMADLDEDIFSRMRDVLFGDGSPGMGPLPQLDRRMAAVMLETLKDLLYESYVRRARFRQALEMRQFFAAQADLDPKVAQLERHEPQPTGTD